VSSAPGDFALNSSASGIFRRRRAIIHRTVRCTPDSVRCSKRSRLWNFAASGIRNGCSAIIHRTCPVYPGLSGVTTGQRLLRANGRLQQQLMRASARRRQARPYWRTGRQARPYWHAQTSGTPILAHRTPILAQTSGTPILALGLLLFFLTRSCDQNSIVIKERGTNCVVALAGKFCSRF
jgi:hypothetical protein